MDANELLKKIIASGADENGIRDRFGDNVELYKSCFSEFMEEPGFVALRDAVYMRNYEQAFEAAHALKGLSGNLGVTGFYNAVRTLTNALRNAQYDGIDELYAQVERQHERLKSIASDEPTPEQEAVSEKLPQAEPKRPLFSGFRSLMKDKNNRLFVYMLCASVMVIAVVGLLFFRINREHTRNVVEESGQHLTEINRQIKLYIENNIVTDWKIAQSVGNNILNSAYVNDDPAVFAMLQQEKAVWGVSDLMLYTKNGYCIYADGATEVTDVASMTVYYAREQGKWLSVIDSKLIYTVPLDTSMTFADSDIVAISVVRDMSSFLDNMDFSSFNEAAQLYITNGNGIVVSTLSGPNAVQAFNIQSIIKETDITPLDKKHTSKDFLLCPDIAVFILSDTSGDAYGVSSPIQTGAEPMRLFYIVSETAVNHIMSGFSGQLLTISLVTIILFAAVAFIVFLFLYKNRKKQFDRAIHTRERMFDLLVKNTMTAFGLSVVNRPQPEYRSANTEQVIGDSFWALDKTDTGFRIHNAGYTETDAITTVNEALQGWDGTHTFRSGYLCNTKNATPTYFVLELYPVGDGASDFVTVAQDVTPIYAREEAVKGAMENAKQANDAKTRFLSRMSHDIRTPMNAIMNMSTFALKSIDQPEKLNNYLHIINESSENLLHLINDILDMSRIESGQLTISSAPFVVREEIQRQTEIIRPLCNTKKQTLITELDGLSGTVVLGDALKFSQIVINLLSNAMKFTQEKGAVRIIAKEIPSLRDNIVTVRLSVEDNGIGIPKTDLKHIFEPFYRATEKKAAKTEGTGLGLAIVKNYIDAMGGTIRCESEPGEGSLFTVELFFQKADSSAHSDNPDTDLAEASFLGMRALVAEDNRINRVIAKEILERMGFVTEFTEDGSEAVQKFCESPPHTYDVIYMDIQMPVMNGYDATLKIRASGHPQAGTVPIIAMTANAFAEDVEKARTMGMDGYVDKPIIPFRLAEETRKAIENKRGEIR